MNTRRKDIAARILGFLAALIGTGWLAVQSPGVQTRLSEKVLASLQEGIRARITAGSISVEPVSSFTLRDVIIIDENPFSKDHPVDTVARIGSVSGKILFRSLFGGGGIHLDRVMVRDAMLHLAIEPDSSRSTGGITNIERVFGIAEKEYNGYAATPDVFEAGRVDIRGFRYRMTNYKVPGSAPKGSVNWSDLDLTADISAHKLKFTGGKMSGIVDALSLTEKSGYRITGLTGRARVGMGKATVEKLHFTDPWSDLKIPLFSMGWNYAKFDFLDFINKIRLELTADSGTLDARTLHALAGTPEADIAVKLDRSHARGYINDLQIERLRFSEPRSGTAADLSATLTGIPDMRNLLTDVRVNNLTFTTAGLQKLLGTFGVKASVSGIAPGRVFSLSARAKGPLNRLRADGRLGSKIGRAAFDLDVRNLTDSSRPLELQGTMDTRNLGLGELLSVKEIGEVTAETGFRATLGKDGPRVSLDSLLIDKFGLMGYEYTGMRAEGTYDGSYADARIICGDPNLNFLLAGRINPSRKAFNLGGYLGYADLQAMNIDRRGRSRVSGSLNADFSSLESGTLTIGGFTVENELGRKDIGDIVLESTFSGDNHMVSLKSDFADMEYFGNHAITELAGYLQDMSVRRELSALYPAGTEPAGGNGLRCDLTLSLRDSRDLLSYLLPGLYIAEGSGVSLEVDEQGSLTSSVQSSLLVWKSNYFKNLDITLDNLDSSLNALIVSDEMSLGEIAFSGVALTGYANDNSLFAGFSYDGIKGITNAGEFYITGDLSRDAEDRLCIDARPLSSFLRFGDQQWNIDESLISWKPGSARIDGFRIHNGTQSFSLDGGISLSGADTLAVDITDVDLSVINYFTGENLDIHGITSGTAVISSPVRGGMHALGYLNCDSLMVGGVTAGSIKAAGVWDTAGDKVNLYVRNIVDGTEAIKASGIYHPNSRSVELTADLDGMNLSMVQPFTGGMLSELSGGLVGTVYASGKLDSLRVYSRGTSIDRAHLKIVPTGVAYTVNGPFHLDNAGLHFDDIAITDGKSGQAVLSGGVEMPGGLGNIMLNSSLRLYGLELLDITGGDGLRGNLFAGGSVYLSGPPDAILLDADLSTAGDGDIHVPLNGFNSQAGSDLLTFTSHEEVYKDPFEEILAELVNRREVQEKKKNSEREFMARLRITANSGTLAVLDLDDSGDNVLQFRGDGTIGINLRPARDIFDISGDYSISEGSYHFYIPGVSKDFTIDNGSSLSFGGDLLESNLDIGATYSLRTSLGRLIADTTSVSTRREVDCKIHIADKLMAPTVTFNIDIPDLDPVTKAEVESALNTDDKIQKQFIALLVTGSFLPDEQSGIVNNPNILYSNVTEIMSRQLSDMLSRLNIPLDMGLGYQQNSSGTDLFDLAVSTQLFDNRVEVHGSVGNRQNNTGTAATAYGDVVGDLDIDWKINRSGQLRLNAFSHSADEYSSYLDNTQRNGAGITYQKEFNTWGEFFRSLFKSRRRRQAEEAEKAAARIPEERVTTSIHE